MEKLFGVQLSQLLGGGRWVQLPDGEWIYIDDDETDDNNDIIYS